MPEGKEGQAVTAGQTIRFPAERNIVRRHVLSGRINNLAGFAALERALPAFHDLARRRGGFS
jgi:hypothetical protein